jgi:2-iminobutanoate/2-iminopropanoate deaminase
VRKQQYDRENNELVELFVLRKNTGSFFVCGNLMPHAIQIRQTRGSEVLNWTPIEVGEPRPGQECLRQADGGLILELHHPDQINQYPQEFAMSKTAITSPELAPTVGPFSQAIEAGGFLYFSGQVAQDPATGKVVEGGIVAETVGVFRNLSAVLKAAGKSFDDVVRAGVYLTSMSDFVAMNGIYAEYFSQPFPARTTIAVAALPLGACVEIDLVVKA